MSDTIMLHSVVPDWKIKIFVRLVNDSFAVDGELWECGVYRGGTASRIIEEVKRSGQRRTIRLFDTFDGIPNAIGGIDQHHIGDFADSRFDDLRRFVESCGIHELVSIYKGTMPESFSGLERSKISFAHIDVDTYRSHIDCLDFVYPRMQPGGIIVFDDYDIASCQGAKRAIDEFFSSRQEPLREYDGVNGRYIVKQ